MPLITPNIKQGAVSVNDIFSSHDGRLSSGEVFWKGIKDSFFSTTMVGASISGSERERAARTAEQEALGEDFIPFVEQQAGDIGDIPELRVPLAAESENFMNKDEYEASEFYEPDLPWSEGLTPYRAKVNKDFYDTRVAQRSLLDKNADTWGRKGLVLLGGLVGNIPDLINIVPFGAGVKSASYLAAAKTATKEALITTAITDAFVFPVVDSLGDEVGVKDVAVDLFFGTALGTGFGLTGHKVRKILEGRSTRAITPMPEEMQASIASDIEASVAIPTEPEGAASFDAFEDVFPSNYWSPDGVKLGRVEVTDDVSNIMAKTIDDLEIDGDNNLRNQMFFENVNAEKTVATAKQKVELLANKQANKSASDVLESDRTYTTITDLRKGKGLNPEHIREDYGAEALKTLRQKHSGIIAKKGTGSAADDLASELGYADGHEMVYSLLDADSINVKRKALQDEFYTEFKSMYDGEVEIAVAENIGKQFKKHAAHIAPSSPEGRKLERLRGIFSGKEPDAPTPEEVSLARYFAEQNLSKEDIAKAFKFIKDGTIAAKSGKIEKVSDIFKPKGADFDERLDQVFNSTISGFFRAVTKQTDEPLNVTAARQAASLDNAKVADKMMQKSLVDMNEGRLPDVGEVWLANPTEMPKEFPANDEINFAPARDPEGLIEHQKGVAEAEVEMNRILQRDDDSLVDEYGFTNLEKDRVYADIEVTGEDGVTRRSVQDITEQVRTESKDYITRYERGLDAAVDCLLGG